VLVTGTLNITYFQVEKTLDSGTMTYKAREFPILYNKKMGIPLMSDVTKHIKDIEFSNRDHLLGFFTNAFRAYERCIIEVYNGFGSPTIITMKKRNIQALSKLLGTIDAFLRPKRKKRKALI
jgi:hypothetical protein